MVSYNPDYILEVLPKILEALPLTLGILFSTISLGSLLGLGLTWAQVSEQSGLSTIAQLYIFMIRCTPPVVLLFMIFYGLPEFFIWWLGLDINGWSRSIFVIIAMVLLFGASISEVFKSAYDAIPKGQLEAGLSIGLTGAQTVIRIILPQAIRIALPNITTAILNLLKDAALAYTIGLADIMGAGNLIIGQNLGNHSLEIYTAVAIIYWSIALVLSLSNNFLEKKFEIK